MSSLSRETVLKALEEIADPETGRSVVESGLVSGVVVRGGNVGFLVNASPENAVVMEPLRRLCESRVVALPGVEKVTAVLTAETAAPAVEKERAVTWKRTPVPGVKHIIAVASGKGGVGKSTLSVCLARAFAEKGLKVGLLDADIYGPSLPLMLGLAGRPEVQDGKMLPKNAGGIDCMSVGLILSEQAAVMRAPMVTKTLNQLLRGTVWNDLDVLVVDMPPGTGDVQLSLAQQVPVSGAIVVTTPQRVATLDAQKAVEMFRKAGVPVLGIIENMSYLEAGGTQLHPFGQGGGEELSKHMATIFLGEVPLLPELGRALDSGAPITLPQLFTAIAKKIFEVYPFHI